MEDIQADDGSFPSPAPSTMKELAYLLPDLDNRGNEFVVEPTYPLGRVETTGISAVFLPDWDAGKHKSTNLAFATYAFKIPGYDLGQSITFDFSSVGALSDAWVGVANYEKDKWDWFPMPESFTLELDFPDYLHPQTETMLVLPLFMGTEEWRLNSIWVGPGFGEGEIRVLDGYVYRNDGTSPKYRVEINITGDHTFSAITDLAGHWVEYFVPEGNYTVRPYQYTHRFLPGSQDVTLIGNDQTIGPFIDANAPLYNASGLVLWPNGATPIPYIDVRIEGDDHGWLFTDRYGIWSASLPDGHYSVRPVSEGWGFAPESQEFTIGGGPVEVGDFIAEELLPQRLEGFIFLEDGETPQQGVAVFIDGEHSFQKTTDIYGYWRVMEIYAGAYRVTPFLDGMVFEPEFVDVDILDEFVELDPFIARTAPQSTIDGTVVQQGTRDPVADIEVTITNLFYSFETATDQAGAWSFGGIPPGTFSITAQAPTWIITPDEYLITVADTDITVGPFIATLRNPFTVFGTIFDEDGQSPLGAIEVWLTGDGVYSTVSGPDGFWSIPEVLEGNYLVQPLIAGREFDPNTRVITVSGSPFHVDDFVLAYHPRHSISGFVWTDTWPTPMAGVPVTVANQNFWYETTTDSEGNWQIDNVLDTYYYIWGELYGYTFDPLWLEDTLDGADLVVDPIEGIVLGTFIVDGYVFEDDGVTPVKNVDVTLDGNFNFFALSDSSGYWSAPSVFEGEYEVSAEKLAWEFTPAVQEITIDGSDARLDDFLGTELAWYTLEGHVYGSDGTTPFPNVQVIAHGPIDRAANTDAFGRFTMLLNNGVYSVFPQKAGYIFSPLNQEAIINDSDLSLDAFIDSGD